MRETRLERAASYSQSKLLNQLEYSLLIKNYFSAINLPYHYGQSAALKKVRLVWAVVKLRLVAVFPCFKASPYRLTDLVTFRSVNLYGKVSDQRTGGF